MKKIIELAERATGDHKDVMSMFASYLALKEVLAKYKRLQQTPITEEWLKEHGWVKDGYTNISPDYIRATDDYRIAITLYPHLDRGAGIICCNIKNNIVVTKEFDGRSAIKFKESVGAFTLADLYDACELCGVELN